MARLPDREQAAGRKMIARRPALRRTAPALDVGATLRKPFCFQPSGPIGGLAYPTSTAVGRPEHPPGEVPSDRE